MSNETIGRRGAIKRALTVLGAAAVAPTLLAGCGEEGGDLTCTDTAGLSEAELATRNSQSYTDSASDASRKCSACSFFTAGQSGECGSCTVIQGPIHPDGTCGLWAAAT